METRVVVDEIDLTTATSLKELLESSGIAVELIGGQSGFPGMPQMGGLRPAGAGGELRRSAPPDRRARARGRPGTARRRLTGTAAGD